MFRAGRWGVGPAVFWSSVGLAVLTVLVFCGAVAFALLAPPERVEAVLAWLIGLAGLEGL